jgi:hypothetical protein
MQKLFPELFPENPLCNATPAFGTTRKQRELSSARERVPPIIFPECSRPGMELLYREFSTEMLAI